MAEIVQQMISEIKDGKIAVPKKPGLGIELDMEKIMDANALYNEHCLGGRDDSIAMHI